jgi:hypothetical protein
MNSLLFSKNEGFGTDWANDKGRIMEKELGMPYLIYKLGR